MASSAKKATFSVQKDVLDALDDAVARGAAPSKNALVERAIVKELKEWRRQARRAQWEEAARDPLFLKDLQETADAFKTADAESARMVH